MTKTRRSKMDPDIALIFWFLRPPSSHPSSWSSVIFPSSCPWDDQFTFANPRHFPIHNVCPSCGRAPSASRNSTGSFPRVTSPATLCGNGDGDVECSPGCEAPGAGV